MSSESPKPLKIARSLFIAFLMRALFVSGNAPGKSTWSSEEIKHHRTERFYWRITAISTLVAAIGAVVTVILSQMSLLEARKAVTQAKRQADIAEDGNRAVLATMGIDWGYAFKAR